MPRRVVMVTDSINAGSLYGGVGTALILSILLAQEIGAPLCLATRTERPDRGNVERCLRIQQIDSKQDVEYVYAGPDGDLIQIGPNDIIITTSWWTTHSALRSVRPEQIVYLIQEDERMFYPYSDEHLLCSEILARNDIRYVVNSALLFEHFMNTGLSELCMNAVTFEPAFPLSNYHFEERAPKARFEFMFYARPNNARNLYYRGLEAIDTAIRDGIFDPERWNFRFVGNNLSPITLSHGITPSLHQKMEWADYAQLVRKVDLGLSLMYTPHPSYPPLDIAASGGVAVTNSFLNKTDLSRYSENIFVSDLNVTALTQALRRGVERASDRETRRLVYDEQLLQRDWRTAFAEVIAHLSNGIA
jgi:hypothetical protein